MRCVIVYILMLTALLVQSQNLVINEATNNAFVSVVDSDGDFPNWVEIYNPMPIAVNLRDYYLSAAANDLMRFQLPDSLLFPGEHTLVLLSGKNRTNDFIHADFSWSSNQKRLYLSDLNGQTVDEIFMPTLPHDISFGRETDGATSFIAFEHPSPGASNNGKPSFTPKNEGLFIWPPNGWYNIDSIRVEISSTNSNLDIRYTLDGSSPTSDAPKFSGSFWLRANPTDTMYYAKIPTNPESSDERWLWKPPNRMPSKNNIISAALFNDSVQVSHIIHRHWFFGNNYPEQNEGIISIISDPDGLFGFDNGLFVPGKTYEDNPTEFRANGNYFNRGRQWERLANVSFFEPDGLEGFSQDIGIRVHGFGSREFPLKSLRLYPRSIYGNSRINYPVFPERNFERYNRLLLRNGGQELFRNVFIDGMSSELAGKLDLEHQLNRPITHYINGEYWGVLNVRDRLDEHFLEYITGIPEKEIFLNKLTNGFWSEHDERWQNFENELKNIANPNTPEALSMIENTIDLDSYIDYFLIRVFIGVYDWPMNNRMLWRTQHDSSKYRSIVIDNDGAFDDFSYNSLEHALNDEGFDWPNAAWSTMVFRRMMSNDVIRKKTINRMEELIMTHFHPDSLDALFRRYVSRYSPLMDDHIDRWQFPVKDINDWYKNVSQISTFINQRPCYIRQFFRDKFELDNSYFNQFNCDAKGFVRPSNTQIKTSIYPNPTSGIFTVDIDMERIQNYTISLINMLGQTIYEREFYRGNKLISHIVDVLEYQGSGSYILRITSANTTKHHRIVKY